jgi:periplasmic protein TonB
MAIRHRGCGVVLALAAWTTFASSARAQDRDTLARAKDYYASANYEEALQVIERLRAQAPAPDTSDVAAYQVFCLVALGRTDQAKKAIEAMVRVDPAYHPSEAQAAPRVRTLYEATRRPLLPQLARATYARAKSGFDKKDLPQAAADFDLTISLIDELADTDDPSLADLRTLSTGFRELCKTPKVSAPPVSATPAAPETSKPEVADAADETRPAPVPVRNTPPAPVTAFVEAPPGPKAASSMPDRDTVYGPEYTDVRPPVAISRDMPSWSPANSFESHQLLTGIMEVVVNENGSVSNATMRKGALPSYDAALLRATASWKFKPATKNGVAVKYRLEVSVQLGREQ